MTALRDEMTVEQISFTLLDRIFRWHEAHRRTHPERDALVLVGGWAVYTYNPWQGSQDIDLLTSRAVRKSMENDLLTDPSFRRVPRHAGRPTHLQLEGDRFEPIAIDFGNWGDTVPREGPQRGHLHLAADGDSAPRPSRPSGQSRALPLPTHQQQVALPGQEPVHVVVPHRTPLLLLKILAAFDRQTRLQKRPDRFDPWELRKYRKDIGDVLALLDPERSSWSGDGRPAHRLAASYLRERVQGMPAVYAFLQTLPLEAAAHTPYRTPPTDHGFDWLHTFLDAMG